MIVNFNPNVSTCQKQKTHFGNEQSANRVKSAIVAALNTKDPQLKIDVKKAREKIEAALGNEDKAGKSILRKFKETLLSIENN